MPKTLEIVFDGAGGKYRPFRGWAAKIMAWPKGQKPELKFGKWIGDPGSLRNAGKVLLEDVDACEVVIYGANSKEMSARDKFTYFGVVGLNDDGLFRLERLKREEDARALWLAGDLKPDPAVLEHAQHVLTNALADGRLDSLLLVFDALDQLFISWRLKAKRQSSSAPGWHITTMNEFRQRIPIICKGVPDLSPCLVSAEGFFVDWESARQKRKLARPASTQESPANPLGREEAC